MITHNCGYDDMHYVCMHLLMKYSVKHSVAPVYEQVRHHLNGH